MSGPSLRHPPQRWSLLSPDAPSPSPSPSPFGRVSGGDGDGDGASWGEPPDALELELEPDDAQCKFARSVLIPVVANLPQGAVGASWH